jgi:hypothetical protein
MRGSVFQFGIVPGSNAPLLDFYEPRSTTVELRPATVRLLLNELERGQFNRVEDAIAHAIRALHGVAGIGAQAS